MRVAIIADIHGNLPALEAVMDDIGKKSADKIICLGDIIGKGPNTREAVDICRNKCDIVVRGNWDTALYNEYSGYNQANGNSLGEKFLWYIESAGAERMEYLGSLPHSSELYLSGKLVRLFHAHPKDFSRYFPDSPIENRLELFGYGDSSEIKETADAAVYADIHAAYMQILHGRYLLNAGSVGNPLDITQASYLILEGGGSEQDSFGIQFVRVPYDIERAIAVAQEMRVPDLDGYITELRTAKYFRR